MKRKVVLTADAERDLESLVDYISEFDSIANAQRVLDKILDAAESLSSSPERGSVPKELRALGIHDYRQIHFKPYRIIYRIFDGRIVIFVIADGRRDFQSLLAYRMLGQ